MRLLAFALTLALPTAAAAVSAPSTPQRSVIKGAHPPGSAKCPRTTSYHAWQRDKAVKPHKLTELPPATTYMAVVRVVNGCEDPLTLIEYRRGGRR